MFDNLLNDGKTIKKYFSGGTKKGFQCCYETKKAINNAGAAVPGCSDWFMKKFYGKTNGGFSADFLEKTKGRIGFIIESLPVVGTV